MFEAHSIIERIIKEGKVEQGLELLFQCQQGAIALGGLIEAVSSDDRNSIPILEEYCEKVYKLYQELCQGRMDNELSFCELQSILNEVKSKAEKDRNVRWLLNSITNINSMLFMRNFKLLRKMFRLLVIVL